MIGNRAFEACSKLATVELGDVKTIGAYAFYRCKALTTIDLSGVVTVKNDAFRSCKKLASVTLSNNILAIEDSAFFDCSALTTVNGTKNLTNIKLFGDLNAPLTKAGVTVPAKTPSNPDHDEIYNGLKDWSDAYEAANGAK